MTNMLNKLVLLVILVMFTIYNLTIQASLLPIIIVIAICGFLEYFDNENLNFYTFIIYILVCFSYPEYIYLLPLVFYDILLTKHQKFVLLCFIPLLFNFKYISINNIAVLIVLSFMEVLLKQKTAQLSFTQSSYISQRDNLTEKSIALENKIIELSEKQNNEINIATLNERNRIAREIHDNVGHLLSSSILQIAAIIATTKDENTKHSLNLVKNTLNDGMDSIRNSVHNLHDNSIDLYIQLKTIIDNFTFCNATLNYELSSNLNIKAKYAVISIVKEALSNVIKHSNATELSVSIYEHPKLIQLIILDNGTTNNEIYNNGMGIESIRQRVSNLNGILNIDNFNRFRIFISFNKNDVLSEDEASFAL